MARLRKNKQLLAVGQVSWVRWQCDGSETDFDAEPQDLPTLRVEVIAAGDGWVEEETWTRNKKIRLGSGGADWSPILPPGARLAGWEMADPFAEGEGSTRWTRRRAI